MSQQLPPGAGAPPPPPPPPGGGVPPPPPYHGTPQPFTVGNAFNYGWTKFQAYLGPLLVAMVGFFVVGAIIYAIFYFALGSLALGGTVECTPGGFNSDGSYYPTQCSGGGLGLFSLGFIVVYGIQMIVMFLYSYLVQAGFTRAGLAITRGEQIEAKTLLSSDKLAQVLLGGVVMAIGTAIGSMLCIIPGLIIAFFGQFFVFFVIDRNMGGIDAIKASFGFVNKNLGTLIGLFLAEILAIFVGALICGIGLIVAVPVVIIAQSFAYRTLNGESVAA